MEQSPPFWAAKALADYVRDQAAWRRTKAAQFPDDPRNASSANALERLALFVEDLESSDRDLHDLIELNAFDGAQFVASDDARRAIASWGFDRDDTTVRRFRDLIKELVAITRRARRTPAQKRDPMITTETPVGAPTRRQAWVMAQPEDEWHARGEELPGDRMRVLCGQVLELGGATRDIPYAPFGRRCEQCDQVARAQPRDSEYIVAESQLLIAEDLLQNAAGSSRSVQRVRRQIEQLIRIDPGSYRVGDAIGELQRQTADLCAVLGPVVAARSRMIALLVPAAASHLETLSDPRQVDELMHPIFAEAGIAYDYVPRQKLLADEHDAFEAAQGDLISLQERRSIAVSLRSAQNALREVGSPPTDSKIALVEAHLNDALEEADAVVAYRIRLADAIQCINGLRVARTPGDRLELTGRAHSAIATVLENLQV